MKKICILAILFVLVGRMFAINYPTYNPDRVDRSGAVVYRTSTVGMSYRAASEAAVYSQMAAPSAYRPVESSASAVGFGAISAIPSIGTNGFATAPHRTGGIDPQSDDDDDDDEDIWTPGGPQTPDNQVPVGDCLFPLLFAALLFAIGKKFSKKSAESTKFC